VQLHNRARNTRDMAVMSRGEVLRRIVERTDLDLFTDRAPI
jgi:hypothetical protein